MAGEGKGGVAIAGAAGLLGIAASSARLCDDAARVGRLGGEVAAVGRAADGLTEVGRAARLVDDPVVAGRLASVGEVAEEGRGARWLVDEQTAAELAVDIGMEVLGELAWDSGQAPLTLPITQLGGMWVATGNPPHAPEAWLCDDPPQQDRRRCGFIYGTGGSLVMVEGLLVVREGLICRAVLVADPFEGLTATETLSALNRHPCEQIIDSDGASLTLRGPAGAYSVRWSGAE